MNADAVPPDPAEVTTPEAPAPIFETPSVVETPGHQDTAADASTVAEPLPAPAPDSTDTACPATGKDAIVARLEELQQHVQKLQQTFDDKLRYDAGREAVIDRLHAEIQEYRADLTFKILRPLCMDLIHLHDEVGKLFSAHRAAAQSEHGAKLLQLFGTFQADVEAILARYGVDSFTTSELQFDPKRQQALRRISTGDPQEDRTVAERCRPGFSFESRILRPEIVTVYVYQPSAES